MLKNIEKKIKKWNETKLVKKTKCIALTFWTVAVIVVPAALSAYLIVRSEDKVVNVVGVLAGVFAGFNLVAVSYKANRTTEVSSKK